MAQKTINKTSKLKVILSLLLVLIACVSLFFVSACTSETEESDTTYTKTENDVSVLKNGSFEFGTAEKSDSDFPQTSSVTGWANVSAENSAPSSSVSSGIIDTTDTAWTALMEKLYDNSTFNSNLKDVYGIDTDAITTNIKSENPDKTDSEIDELIKKDVIDKLNNFNPGTHENAEGTKVYMLNAYSSSAWNTSVIASSSTTLALEKGEYAKISFYVYTRYADGNDYKINFRLTNSINSQKQSQYVLSNIGKDEWKQYTIYLKADENFDSTITAVMSIGFAAKSNVAHYSKGTAFFDDIVFETIEKEEFDSAATVKNVDFNNKVKSMPLVQQAVENVYNYAYDMTVTGAYFTPVDFLNAPVIDVNAAFTGKNENVTSEKKFGAETSKFSGLQVTSNSISLTNVEHASVSVSIKDNSGFAFKIDPESYLLLSFDIVNNLDKTGSTDITLFVYDEKDNENNVVTFNGNDDKDHGYIVINNNDTTEEKTFYIVIVIGPTDVKGTLSKYDFATKESGKDIAVALTNFEYATGKNFQYKKDAGGNVIQPKEETENYKYFSLYSSLASSVSIDSYVSPTTKSFNVAAAKSVGGDIHTAPVVAEGYIGVDSNSILVKDSDDANDEINARVGKTGDGNGNYAGLINSNVNYTGMSINVKDSLNYNGENSIQPLMICNGEKDSYGFIGKSFSVAASSKAIISVKVKTDANAKAFLYLTDAADKNKTVLDLTLTGNVSDNSYKTEFTKNIAFENINTNGEWKTYTFYLATGANALELRLELWNGSRDGNDKSQGFVFFAFDAFKEDETFTPSTISESAFTEPTSISAAFDESGNPIYDANITDEYLKYRREFTPLEIKFNSERPDEAISYPVTYVWAKNENNIYAIYNTVEPVEIDPYSANNDETASGCTAESDPSTFWLSFSSILLGAALVVALIALIVKNGLRRHKANKSDATSHYKVTSRYNAKKSAKKPAAKKQPKTYEDEEPVVDAEKDAKEETAAEPETAEEEYVYGEVEDFGESDKPEEPAVEVSEEKPEGEKPDEE